MEYLNEYNKFGNKDDEIILSSIDKYLVEIVESMKEFNINYKIEYHVWYRDLSVPNNIQQEYLMRVTTDANHISNNKHFNTKNYSKHLKDLIDEYKLNDKICHYWITFYIKFMDYSQDDFIFMKLNRGIPTDQSDKLKTLRDNIDLSIKIQDSLKQRINSETYYQNGGGQEIEEVCLVVELKIGEYMKKLINKTINDINN